MISFSLRLAFSAEMTKKETLFMSSLMTGKESLRKE
jgi:hypothetical protein